MWKSQRTLRGGSVCFEVSVIGRATNIIHLGEDREFFQTRQGKEKEGSSCGWTTLKEG